MLAPPITLVPPTAANGSSSPFPAKESKLLLLPHHTAALTFCREGQMWKHLLLLKCEKAVVEAAGLQCMAQICLVTAAVVILPSNFCGPCSNMCWAHPHVPHTPGHLANSKAWHNGLFFLVLQCCVFQACMNCSPWLTVRLTVGIHPSILCRDEGRAVLSLCPVLTGTFRLSLQT